MTTYSLSRDDIADLALPGATERAIRAVVAEHPEIGSILDEDISSYVDQYGWDGDWSAADVVQTILSALTSEQLKPLDDATIAALHAISGYGTDDPIAAEFLARHPHHDGFRAAARFLREQAYEAWTKASPDPMTLIDYPEPEAAVAIEAEFRRLVDRIAEAET